MERKIQNATSYFLKYRHCGNCSDIKNDAANYFADSYEEYMILWNHLDAFERRMNNGTKI